MYWWSGDVRNSWLFSVKWGPAKREKAPYADRPLVPSSFALCPQKGVKVGAETMQVTHLLWLINRFWSRETSLGQRTIFQTMWLWRPEPREHLALDTSIYSLQCLPPRLVIYCVLFVFTSVCLMLAECSLHLTLIGMILHMVITSLGSIIWKWRYCQS